MGVEASRIVDRGRAVLALVGVVWVVSVVDIVLGGALNRFGIVPRDLSALPGIAFAPFLHTGFAHLASNTVPLLVLGAMVALRGVAAFWWCTTLVAVGPAPAPSPSKNEGPTLCPWIAIALSAFCTWARGSLSGTSAG